MITAHISSSHVLADGELHIIQHVLGDEWHVTVDALGDEQCTIDGVALGDGQDVLHTIDDGQDVLHVIVDDAHDTLQATVGQDVLHTIDELGEAHEVLLTTIDSVIHDTLLSSYSSLTALLVPASPRYTLSSFTKAAVE